MTAHDGRERRWWGGAHPVGAGMFIVVALLALYLVPRSPSESMSLLRAVEFLVFGFAVGAYGTMVGAGGGFLIVPALILVAGAAPEMAAGTSLTVIFINALFGTVSYARMRRIDYRSGFLFALATIPGSIIGASLSSRFSGPLFNKLFGVLMLLLAAFLIWRPKAEEEMHAAMIASTGEWYQFRGEVTDATGARFAWRYNMLIGMTVSLIVGFFASILGIGGGIIHVPVLTYVLGFPAHIATATSHFILAISSLIGAGSHLALGHVLMGPAVLMGIGAAGGSQMGARIAMRLRGGKILRLLSLALIVVGVRLLLK
ncbi:MAG TPA: sulfite exporter TauE/SafE family protein [Gemmatimonadales bacterium]|nr:sulfite exporter TauE/SafE family protein [Gemmatimonadales bacterium]